MKILLITPTSEQVITFRAKLIECLKKTGYNISVLTFDDKYKSEIINNDIEFHCFKDKNRSLNPFKVFTLKRKYCKVIKLVKPNIVFTFMLKPNIFGVLAAKKAKVEKIFSMVEGAGDVFINNGLKWKLIRGFVCCLYKKAFKNCRKVFFLNNDDKNEFVQRKLVNSSQCEVISGIGVDLEKFKYKPIKNYRTFLMVARMLKTKGIFEYCECARIVKRIYPDIIFNYLGAEGTVKLADIQEYIDDGSINYLGTTKDVRPFYEDCFVYVLPSYREGLPVSIMEAEATGRAIISSLTNGCRDTVSEYYNGFLVNICNIKGMTEKIIWCIEHPNETEQMGKNARQFAEKKFDVIKINQLLVKSIYENG